MGTNEISPDLWWSWRPSFVEPSVKDIKINAYGNLFSNVIMCFGQLYICSSHYESVKICSPHFYGNSWVTVGINIIAKNPRLNLKLNQMRGKSRVDPSKQGKDTV